MKLIQVRKIMSKATLAIALALIMATASIMPLFAAVDSAHAETSGISAVPGELFFFSPELTTPTSAEILDMELGTNFAAMGPVTAVSARCGSFSMLNANGEISFFGMYTVGGSNWTAVASGGSLLGINEQGELWSWGFDGFSEGGVTGFNASGVTGFGVDAFGFTLTPTRMGTASNWTAIAAGDQHFLAINEDGELFAWGCGVRTGFGTDTTVPTRVGIATNWTAIAAGESHSLAINASGELWSWGGGISTGHGNDLIVTPTQVGTASNWTAIAAGSSHSLAINSSGELWGWGSNSCGAGLGDGVDYALVPTRVGIATNWTAISAGCRHSLAINANGELFSWGSDIDGWGSSTLTPTQVGTASNWTAIAAGCTFSFAIASDTTPTTLPPTLITKSLELNQGVSIPNLTFNFTFEPTRTVLREADTGPPPVTEILTTEHNITIPVQSITINNTTYDTNTLSGGVRTKTNYLDIASVISGIDFPSGGIFSWLVEEDLATGYTSPPSHINYSQAVYELRVHVNRDGVPTLVELVIVTPDRDTQTIGAKEDEMSFTNIYTRQVGTPEVAALSISKVIPDTEDNLLANTNTDFEFTVTLTNPVHTSTVAPAIALPLTAFVYEGTTQVRTETFNSLTHTFDLRHNQRLVIPNLPAGATFVVSEDPTHEFTPSYRIYLRGAFEEANTGTLGNILTTDPHFIDTGRNAAEFSNNFQWSPPTGLFISNLPFALIGLVAILLALMAVKRQRRTIEELPIVL